ncbi:MAG: ribosome silencing factor [Lachnospiraceae bacterium]|nr:ribosome silencing factor [Lachnospiraceae bacterium]
MDKIRDMVNDIYKALEDKKADDVKLIDISEISDIADYFVIATANNTSQMDAMQDAVDEYMTKAGISAKSIEGHVRDRSNWILMDYRDIIVHIFDKEAREFYNLDRIWKDGKEISPTE